MLLQFDPLLGEVTMDSSMSEYTSFTANMSQYTKNEYTYYSHSSNSQCTVVQWENPLAVQYHQLLFPTYTLQEFNMSSIAYEVLVSAQ